MHASREEAKELIQLYYKQVTKGCGQEDCENDVCASNKRFKRQMSNEEAAAKALSLFKKQSKLCVFEKKETPPTSSVSVGEDDEYLAAPVQETGGQSAVNMLIQSKVKAVTTPGRGKVVCVGGGGGGGGSVSNVCAYICYKAKYKAAG